MGKTFKPKKKSATKSKDVTGKQPLHENFREYTLQELNQIKVDVCVKHKCPYLSKLKWVGKHPGSHTAVASMMCNYILFEEHSRGCMPDVCEYWKNKDVKKKTGPDNRHLFDNHVNFNDID